MLANASRYFKQFGAQTFDINTIPARTRQKLRNAILNNTPIDREMAYMVALELKRWALSMGATHYSHWFHPLTGSTAEKHNTFLQSSSLIDNVISEDFSADELVRGEPDASSFPHGGMRSTFEARGYSVWDPSSPAFIMTVNDVKTLFIPSIFIAYTGHVLDKKTPLLRSMKALSDSCRRLLALLGRDVAYVQPFVGPEQEYFLVHEHEVHQRLDLRLLGYTLLGAPCPRGQKFQDHYFGAVNDNVLAFMEESEEALVRLGVPVKTRHNEVAPNQFELAVLPENANIAADHNQLTMEVLKRAARKHGFYTLLHEKPFAGINGSGKHNNWSLITADNENLFDPPETKEKNLVFLSFISCVVRAVHRCNGLLRSVFANAGNDMRFGANEAPPAIVSLFLGKKISDLLFNLGQQGFSEKDALKLGLPFLPNIERDYTDRNRTAPIAFTGNKFEFRMMASSQSIAFPNTAINLAMAEAVDAFADQLKQRLASQRLEQAVSATIAGFIKEHQAVIYNGNTYTDKWEQEAARRGLFLAKDTPSALLAMHAENNLALFASYNILQPEEVMARYRIKLQMYIDTVETELRVTRDMIRTRIIPSVFDYQGRISHSIDTLAKRPGHENLIAPQSTYLARISLKLNNLLADMKELDTLNEAIKPVQDLAERARFCAQQVRPAIQKAREQAAKLEERVSRQCWNLSRYADIYTF